jgi:dienelactone hydrolase
VPDPYAHLEGENRLKFQFRWAMAAMAMSLLASGLAAQSAPVSSFKDEMRLPWTRGGTEFIRRWMVAGPITCRLEEDCVGDEVATRPADSLDLKLANGTSVKWRGNTTWGDVAGIGGDGPTGGAVGYAHAVIMREKAGRAALSLGSDNGLRAWLNGRPVLVRDGVRALALDDDLVEVEFQAGANLLLIKVEAGASFAARVLESGAVLARTQEIAPVIRESSNDHLIVATDAGAERATQAPVKITVIRPGGEVVYSGDAARGEHVRIEAARWSDGPYEVRLATLTAAGRSFTTHLAWYKGDALAKARELAAAAAQAGRTPEGITLRMLTSMVEDRLGAKIAEARGNPWRDIHSPLMEYEELMLERAGKPGRVREHGFVRLAWVDETDDTPQFCRAYLPGSYAASRKWPLVLQLHGFNPANPLYWDWWSADNRHGGPATEAASGGVIYIEPHGRGNVQYRAFADTDVLRCMAEARKLLSIDENRTYLTGDSMGGWGTWNVATRHPELFAAIAPVFGGVDYHATMPDEVAAKLTPAERFINEKDSSWSMADGLVNTPIFVHHGDKDEAVNVEWSRWGVRLLQRWGYDVRYREYPGKIHEALQINNGHMNIDWFLRHERDPAPRQVRVRSGDLRHAGAWWARVQQASRPLAFIVVDAEVVDHNVIRLDTDNVVDIVLSPPAAVIDPTKPVRVVWNGVTSESRMKGGELRLTQGGYKPARLHKSPRLPGGTADFFNTPFAVVVGSTAKDPNLRALVETKAKGFVDAWKDWQKFEPRVFKDTEISDADVAKYSLILIGGADANAVTAKLASGLPLKIAADRVLIDGKAFPARDAAVQLLYPNPRNAERYVWLFASTSPAGMNYAMPLPFRTYEWDFVIDDGRIPAPRQPAPRERTNVVSGMFDQNWRLDAAYLQPGDEQVRTAGRTLAWPGKSVKLPAAVLESYVGSYEMPGNRIVEVTRKGDVLWARAGADDLEFVPLDEKNFYGAKFNVWVTFETDAAGKVTGFTGHQPGDGDFEATRK